VIVYHPVHLQVFYRNQPELVDNAPTVLVREIVPAPPNSFMHTSYNHAPLSAFRSFGGAFRLFGEKALHFSQSLFFHTEEAGVLNLLPGGKGSERLQPYINADLFTGHGQSSRLPVTCKGSVPFTSRGTLDTNSFGVPSRGR